jgi:hypothetical protein
LYGAGYFAVHGDRLFIARQAELVTLKGNMPRPKAHYSLLLKNHQTGERLKLELVDLPFATSKSFRLRVNPVR